MYTWVLLVVAGGSVVLQAYCFHMYVYVCIGRLIYAYFGSPCGSWRFLRAGSCVYTVR